MSHLLTEGESERAYETRRESLNLHCCGVPGDYCQNVAKAQLAKTIAEIEALGVPVELDKAAMRDFGYAVVQWLREAKKEIA